MTRRVHFAGLGAEADAAWEWLVEYKDLKVQRSSAPIPSPGKAEVCWWHTDQPLEANQLSELREWVERGGRLFLTLDAVEAAHLMDIEPTPPNERRARRWRSQDDELRFSKYLRPWSHRRGIAGFGCHPLFSGFCGSSAVYTWEPTEGESYVWRAYTEARPSGEVVGCERSYININPDRIVAWEYAVGRGGILGIGAFVYFRARDASWRPHLECVISNVLAGNVIPHQDREPACSWPKAGTQARRDEGLELPDIPDLTGSLPGHEEPLGDQGRALQDHPWELSGRRILALGGEQSGLLEVWAHPNRLVKEYRVRIAGETPLVRDAYLAPDVVIRHLVTRYRIVEETAFVALEHPIIVLDYRAMQMGRGRNIRPGASLELSWETDLRRAWPYRDSAYGDLRFHSGEQVLIVTDENRQAIFVMFANRAVQWMLQAVKGRAAVRCILETTLDEPLRLAIVGALGRDDLHRALGALRRRKLVRLVHERAERARERSERWTALRSPDAQLDTAFEWAKARLDGFIVDTPGIGRSLVAGHAASAPGWSDGRPGYAWFFARDACWVAPAFLALGDIATVRHVLRFLSRSADIAGKVPHELTTSGIAHYDAADSTPLYLLLAAQYAKWTGDLPFLREHWQQIERAYRFCLGTDRDGDGLIENRGVGHGWIESGPLAGAEVTLYLAAVWEAALRELAPVARALGSHELATELDERAATARHAIMQRFKTAEGYALGIRADGTRQEDRTALQALPLLLGAVDQESAPAWFEWVASEDATTPWGVRMVGQSHVQYSPCGYHNGAVWPLFGGWVALAEYRHHLAAEGFEHLQRNARLPYHCGAGMFAEVLSGEEEKSVGVCPNQAWSAAMLVRPMLEGLLGLAPDALRHHLDLRPHLPARWDGLDFQNLQIGETVLDLHFRQREDRISVSLRRHSGPPLGVTVDPALPPGRSPDSVFVDDVRVTPRVTQVAGCCHAAVDLELRGEQTVSVVHVAEQSH